MEQIKQMRVILASGSPRRRELLQQIDITPLIQVSDVDETIETTLPWEAVRQLSLKKASAVADQINFKPGTCIIGADTVVALDDQILGKPSSHGDAFQMIQKLQGRTHKVYTGVTMIAKLADGCQTCRTFCEETSVVVFPMSEEEIKQYADSDEPMDKAGAYGIQGKFASFIKEIQGDYSNVVGLPVGRVYQEMKHLCHDIQWSEPEKGC